MTGFMCGLFIGAMLLFALVGVSGPKVEWREVVVDNQIVMCRFILGEQR